MKKFILIMLTVFTAHANAGLISYNSDKTSYLTGETVFVDLFVNNINPNAAELFFDYSFNDIELTFNSFTFSDDVLNSAFITNADTFSSPSILTIESIWFDSLDLPASSFELGQISFTAKQANTPVFEINNLEVNDINYNNLAPQIASVSEPQTWLLFMLTIIGFILKRKTIKS